MPTAQLPGVGELLEAAVTAVGGTRREGQDTMAQAVRSAIATGEHVAVQAGTGTGKSLAYLVPAIHHAVEKNSTVVISTATIALQRQLVDRDLPRVAKALKPLLGRTPTFAILKGRRNYLCLNKLHGGDENPEDELFDPFQISAMGRAVKRIHEWADDTETGDRDELVPGVPDSTWRMVSVTARECLRAGVVAAVARRLGRLIDQSIADRLAEAGEGLGLVLEDLRPGRWEALPQPASGALSAVLDAAAACRTGLGGERREEPDAAANRKIAQAALEEVLDTTARLLKAFDEPDPAKRYDVVWLAEVGADRHKVLHAAPLWVGGLLRERLFGRSTVVLTSATLALGGNFDALARQWGLPPAEARTDDPVPDPEAPKWSGLDVGSPFAHAKSGILYVAKSLPPPGRDGLPQAYLDEIAGLVEAAGGRTLGLFSSMRAAKQATEALRDRLTTPLLCQGDDATMLLVKRFAEDDETSLFGTLSLWQGVDVPGPSLSCVIIDRIPFPRPDDPLVSARQRAADSRGGNGFLQVSATHAALLLAQGAGRLLRGMDDRGVVAILDPRLATARYGGFLRASLPPFWPTDDRAKVHAALRRLRGA